MSLFSVLILYVCFRLKQFVCDFLLQTQWMASHKGKPGALGLKALFVHTAIHGLGTTAVVLCFAPSLWWLGLVDFIVHSLIDRLKGLVTYYNGWKHNDRMFWWALGLDQEAHNFTHLIYILYIIQVAGGVILLS